jgi:hypothetical protein
VSRTHWLALGPPLNRAYSRNIQIGGSDLEEHGDDGGTRYEHGRASMEHEAGVGT